MPEPLMGRWALGYDRCKECGTTERKHDGHGLCRRCFAQWRRKTVTVAEITARFWPKVRRGGEAECWEWTGARQRNGYGAFTVGPYSLAHRAAYSLTIGPVPDELTIDHLCRNRGCVNPAHMEVVTRGENTSRGGAASTAAERKRAKRECPNGHPYTVENTYMYKERRHCKTCRATNRSAWRSRRDAA